MPYRASVVHMPIYKSRKIVNIKTIFEFKDIFVCQSKNQSILISCVERDKIKSVHTGVKKQNKYSMSLFHHSARRLVGINSD